MSLSGSKDRISKYSILQVPSDMGNKPSVSEGEEEDERSAPSLKGAKSLGAEIANGSGGAAGEEADEELELPPPMKPIQEPILVTPAPPSLHSGGVSATLEDNPCKRVSDLTLKSLEGATSADLAEIEQL
ncbi:hypothetical protein JTB14_035567 [Gonioctena quinquepunctata]|nr:hypothetical protein JTB14_035567 [Gonioctena quinquepunctata]